MKKDRLSLALFFLIAALLTIIVSASAAEQSPETKDGVIYRGVMEVVNFDISPRLDSMEPAEMQVNAFIEILDDFGTGLEGPLGPQDTDLLVQRFTGNGEIPAAITSFNGPTNSSGVSPPDPNGDVGPNHVVVMSNLSFAVYDKTGTILLGPLLNNTLWSGFGGDCQTDNSGDPVVVYDQLADRWLLTQFTASGPTYFECVALSQTSDPTGAYYRWAISTGTNFPDYPKVGVWPDGYYFSTRDFAGGATFAGIGAYAMDRAEAVAGDPNPTVISFLVPPGGTPYNIGDGLLPADLDGSTLPPAGSPNFFVGSMDNGGPYGAPLDALTLWEFDADFTTPANSTFGLVSTLPIAAYDTIFPCSPGGRDCIPQPGTATKIDILSYRQRPMFRLAYRNFGTHEALVTNQSVEASPGMAGMRWWEIRDPGGTPFVYQEGTYAPGVGDGIHRWMGSIAMDRDGNMALGYSASNGTTTFPSVWYTGRLAGDPLGTMPQGEGSIVNGSGSQTGSQRWGDYTSMSVDPVDDCTFWHVNQWVPSTSSVGWVLRIGSFKFDECGQPDFFLNSTPVEQDVCTPSDALYTINVGQVQGYTDPVTLSASGNPAGTTAGFSTNPVVPPGASTLTIGNTGAAAFGSYAIDVVGVAPTSTHTTTVTLNVYTAAPAVATLVSPANAATGLGTAPAFSWDAIPGAATYSIQVATDAGFSNIVASATGLTSPAWVSNVSLNTNTTYYWRVLGDNACGAGSYSSTFAFTTVAAPGDCGVGSTANILYTTGFEAGADGWTSGGTGNSWALAGTNPHAGASHFHANNPAIVSDQLLISPAFALPSGENPVALKFWHAPNLENSGLIACYDGGILEISTDAGANWTQVPNTALLAGGYTGPVSASFSNPLAGLQAWCGATGYIQTVADLSAYAGMTVQLRLRLGSDTSVSDLGWDVDDVTVQSCQPVAGGSNLDLSMDDGGVSITFGTTVEYTLGFTNTGALPATNVVLTATVPAGAVFDDSHNPPGWSCSDGALPGSVCTYSYGSLAAGESGSLVFAVRPPSSQGGTAFVINASADIADAEGDSAMAGDSTPVENAVVHIASIQLNNRSTLRAYIAAATVKVVNQFGVGVDGLSFHGEITDHPDGNTGTFTRRTSKGGLASLTSRSQNPGQFTVCALNVVGPGVTYDSGSNVETCDSLTIPAAGPAGVLSGGTK